MKVNPKRRGLQVFRATRAKSAGNKIGIRLALGALGSEVLLQFLVEAVGVILPVIKIMRLREAPGRHKHSAATRFFIVLGYESG